MQQYGPISQIVSEHSRFSHAVEECSVQQSSFP